MDDTNQMEAEIDPHRGIVCQRARHLVAEHTAIIPGCARCGAILCPECLREGVRLALCPLGDPACRNVRAP